MRERDINRKMFHKGHYEVIAKRIRTELEKYPVSDEIKDLRDEGARFGIIELTFALARRFEMDNSEFDVEIFLTRCSPDGWNLYTVWLEAGEDHG